MRRYSTSKIRETQVRHTDGQHAHEKMLNANLLQALWDPMDCSPPGSFVHGILQARILDRVAIFPAKGSSRPRD